MREALTLKSAVQEQYDCIIHARAEPLWCCVHRGSACSNGTAAAAPEEERPRAAAAEAAAPPRGAGAGAEPAPGGRRRAYDCYAGRGGGGGGEGGEGGWSYAQRAYCCSHFDRGCQLAAPGARSSSSSAAPSGGCGALCAAGNRTASCRSRIQHAAGHRFLREPEACRLAHRAVLADCQGCSACSLEDSACASKRATATASVNYDCKAGYDNWVMGWSAAKKAWCCRNKDRGCPSELAGMRQTR